MIFKELKPKKALNKAFLKVKPGRAEIEDFKYNLITLLDRTNNTESEEFHKNLVIDFLNRTYYEPSHYINTKGHNDLVIHNEQNANSSVGVIIEAKKPSNKTEMISKENINKKAFQELVLYYLRERITNKNVEIKHLIATNIYEWFIFDSTIFDRIFAQNNNFLKQFNDFEDGRLADTKTDFFYKQIAGPFIDTISTEIEFTYFNLQEFEKPLRNNKDKAEDKSLIVLYKLFSPEHLLKLPFANDSNSLDKRFYSELLHIIGLTEAKVGNKKIIERKEPAERQTGTILEDTIIQLDSLDKLNRLEKQYRFGNTTQERLFNVAIELSITWINRILFLKLLEAQLISYHKGDKSFAFLNQDKIRNYDELNSLFFQVLARKYDERNEDVKKAFEKVPYLNSSLFEPTEIEQVTLFISNLKDSKTIPIFSQTVLKDTHGKRRIGNISTLAYLFEFLNAYDFSSEGTEEIQEENKTLINASVLGLIFEKINGYKDGSFFTPGFITMYMCRETIRKAVVQKFNEIKNWNCTNFDELYNKIENIAEANSIVNSIKICDPAVGSGHFLVSTLNEMIAVKNDLGILCDFEGKPLRNYWVEVHNDELFITEKESGEEFYYLAPTPRTEKTIKQTFGGKIHTYKAMQLPERQVVQQSIFHEKQSIIENCLFGVDINPNSVKICRLRLWIELLKNAYYTVESNFTALETLPNIDINIKCGNSLVSRFAIDADLKQELKRKKWTIESYKIAVQTYRNAENWEQKREMKQLISEIKLGFGNEISRNDPKVQKLNKLEYEYSLLVAPNIFREDETVYGNKDNKNKAKDREIQLLAEVQKLRAEIVDFKTNKIYENAFEWRFEFPEVLNEDGDFVGFDVVIGNPPYFIMTKNNMDKPELNYYLNNYQTIGNASSKNIFNLFIELGIKISNKKSYHSMIVPEGLFETRSYKGTIDFFQKSGSILNITRIEGMVFDEANTGNVIFIFSKNHFPQIPKHCVLKKNQKIVHYYESENSIISKIDNLGFPILSDFCKLFKGMVLANRKDSIFENQTENLPNKFILGNCISKWKIENYFFTNYEKISIIGGTKVKEKYDIFPRILIRRTGNYLCCAYLTEPALTESTLYSCWSTINEIDNLFILGVLHSKVVDFYTKNKLVTNPQAYPQILMTDLQTLPIPLPSLVLHDAIKNATERRLKTNNNSLLIEKEIDKLVYKLYNLTKEEIQIVEGIEYNI